MLVGFFLIIYTFRTWRKCWSVLQRSSLSFPRIGTPYSIFRHGQVPALCRRPASTFCCPMEDPAVPAVQAGMVEAAVPTLKGSATPTPVVAMLGAVSPAPCQIQGGTRSPASLLTAAQVTVWLPVRAPVLVLGQEASWSLCRASAEILLVEAGVTVTVTQTVDVPRPARAQARGHLVGAGSPCQTVGPVATLHPLWRVTRPWCGSSRRSWGNGTWSSSSSEKIWTRMKLPSARWDTVASRHRS